MFTFFAVRCPLCRAVALLNDQHDGKKSKPQTTKKNKIITRKRAKSKECKKTWDFEDKWFD